ncbi:MAG: cation diffusion facilitator family transporter, partial [Lentisphaeria bacterium]
LMVFKLAAGHWGQSEAVFADGVESACDFVALLATLVALRISRQPSDRQHPYGHGRAESIAAVFVSLVILLTGLWIFSTALHSLCDQAYPHPQWIAVAAALATILVKSGLYRYSAGIGRRLGSPALLAVAGDHRKDALTSIATLVGVSAAFAGWGWMDPLAAGLTSFFILKIGYDTFRNAARDLMDTTIPEDITKEMTGVAEAIPGVEHVHEIKGRRSGQFLIIDLKLEMEPQMTVKQAHDIATEVKKALFAKFPEIGDVMIHVNPHDEEHEDLTRL